MQTVVLKKLSEFGIDYQCSFRVIFFPRELWEIRYLSLLGRSPLVKVFHTSTPGEQWGSRDLFGVAMQRQRQWVE